MGKENSKPFHRKPPLERLGLSSELENKIKSHSRYGSKDKEEDGEDAAKESKGTSRNESGNRKAPQTTAERSAKHR